MVKEPDPQPEAEAYEIRSWVSELLVNQNHGPMKTTQKTQGRPVGTIRVLVADDNDFFRGVVGRLIAGCEGLELAGTAANGCEALKAVGHCHPDLAILDLQMSGLNGLQTAALIQESFPSTRVIIMSAEDSEAVQETCLAQGVDGFVPKRRLYRDLGQRLAELFPQVFDLNYSIEEDQAHAR